VAGDRLLQRQQNGEQRRIMQTEATIALALTVHEPDERLAVLTAAHLPALASCYAQVAAYCSRETQAAILDLLRRHGARVEVDGGVSSGIDRLGVVRRETLRAGLRTGCSHLHLCDFDRAIHWVSRYPRELEAVIAAIPGYDLLVLGRTARAWDTHPPYQAETEPLFNRVFGLVSGRPWDVGAGSRGLSRRAVETLLAISQEPTVGVDAEWPLLLLNCAGYRVGHRVCEGLEFETADRFGAEIETAGGYAAWEAQMSADPRRWAFRLKVALLIAEAAIHYGRKDQ
jgi:hypothetical protein